MPVLLPAVPYTVCGETKYLGGVTPPPPPPSPDTCRLPLWSALTVIQSKLLLSENTEPMGSAASIAWLITIQHEKQQ
jgi:hypothetical protein